MVRFIYRHVVSRFGGRGRLWRVRMFVERGMDGYCTEDVWGVDCFLAKVLPPMLRELKGTGFTDDITQDEWDAMYERWASEWEKIGGCHADYDKKVLREWLRYIRSQWY